MRLKMLKQIAVLMAVVAPVLLTRSTPAAVSPSDDGLHGFINMLTNKRGAVGCYWTVCCEGWSQGHCTRWYRCCVGSILPGDGEQIFSTDDDNDEKTDEPPSNPSSFSLNEGAQNDHPNDCWTSGRCTVCCSYKEAELNPDNNPIAHGSRSSMVSKNKQRIKSFFRKMRHLQSAMGITTDNNPNDCISQGHCIMCCD